MSYPSLNHTMFRTKDAKIALDFFTRVVGMELLRESPGSDFTNYFLAFPLRDSEGNIVEMSAEEKAAACTSREGVLELCHNHGTENDADFKYASGNEEPGRGFGHIAVSVPDVQAECDRLQALGVRFKKLPHEGRMRHIAFYYSEPDSYWIEVVPKRMP